LAYLSNKYDFINGYFRNVQGDFDRWLAAAHYMFVALTALISVSVFAHADRHAHRLVATAGMVFPLVVAIGLRYRTFMATIILMMTACWLTLRPEKWKRGLLLMAVTGVLLFVLGSTVKVASVRGSTASILANLTVLQTATIDDLLYATNDAAQGDRQYRLAGFEMPAAILRCLHNGTEPSYGTGFYHGVISALPAFLRPEGDVSERETIYQRFSGCGLVYGDSIGVPLTSGLADWGIWLSPVVYAFLAFYCLAVWRVAQLSNRFYLAMLMTTAGLGDLLWDLAWDDGLLMIRGIVFAWLVLFVTGPLLMPRSKENARELFGRLPPRANRSVPAIAHGRP
jgi:hypothetical protein